jgi:putative membrane protein
MKGINVIKTNREVNAYEILMNIDNVTNLDGIININNNLQNIELNENNYVKILHDIGKNVGRYKGKKIKLSGFVYKDSQQASNEFILSRLVMTCCAADSQVIGIKSVWQDTPNLNNNEWVKIEGNIELSQDGVSPVIRIEKIEKIKRPDNIYVYE